MKQDGGLGKLFQDNIREAHWQRIESPLTGGGIPDLNGCMNGVEVWIENKKAKHWKVKFEQFQIGWAERRVRAGGNYFLAVRQILNPKRGTPEDNLWLFKADALRRIEEHGLPVITAPVSYGYVWRGDWDWPRIAELVFQP